MPTLRILAPLMLAWVFVRGPLGPENRLQLVRLNASVQIAAAALLAIGKLPRLAALTLAASLVPTALAGHAFWRVAEPGPRAQQEIHFNKNLAMIGGLIVVVLQESGRQRRGR
jgi:uncharacterized membrane protein YphA (DoxX/SURF4 family)